MTRVLHLIDSLALGGAERVAVNLANEQIRAGYKAWLCATRAEGPLKEKITYTSQYIFLEKQSALDFSAFFRLVKLLRRERIEVVHAHSSSLFWGVVAKWFTGCKLVWHDHAGEWDARGKFFLQLCSLHINSICSVNKELADWSRKYLWIAPEKVHHVNHFATLNKYQDRNPGNTTNILCVANLRVQKDHLNLLAAVHQVAKSIEQKDWMVYLVGDDTDTTYKKILEDKTEALGISAIIRFAGPQADIESWLFKSHIGVLSSRSEGLPVALLEYGLAGLAVVCTDVGACKEVLGGGKYGILVPPADSAALGDALLSLLLDAGLRQRLGASLAAHTVANYSAEAAVRQLENIYREVLHRER